MHGLRSCLLAAAAVLVATAGLTVPAGPAAAGGPTFVISGGGFGHGVGMSQWGAKGQADQGRTAAQILSHYYTGTAVGALPQPNPTVLVATSVFSRIFPAAGGSGPVRLIHQDGTVMLTANPGDTVILELTEDRQWFRASVNGMLVPLKPAPGAFVFVELNFNPTLFDASGHRYRYGRLVAATAGDMIEWIAQDMTMDQYLYGLGEVPSSWPAEALKAQAIAARTYAENRTETRRASPSWTRRFDLFGSTSDQVFIGYDKEAGPFGANWVAAVDTTAGGGVDLGWAGHRGLLLVVERRAHREQRLRVRHPVAVPRRRARSGRPDEREQPVPLDAHVRRRPARGRARRGDRHGDVDFGRRAHRGLGPNRQGDAHRQGHVGHHDAHRRAVPIAAWRCRARSSSASRGSPNSRSATTKRPWRLATPPRCRAG